MLDESSENEVNLAHPKRRIGNLRCAIMIFVVAVAMFSAYLILQPFRYYSVQSFLSLVFQFSILVFVLLVIAVFLANYKR